MNAVHGPARLLYPVDEAASRLGIQRTSLYALLKEGELERVKIGRRTLITAESLTGFIKKLRETAGDLRE